MKKAILTLGALLSWMGAAQAAAPQTLNYQGRLRQNIAGSPVVPDSTGNTVTFNLWPTATGGSVPLWTETWSGSSNGVSTVSGLFNVILGSINPINLPFDQPYYLEIQWTNPSNAIETLSPRQPLTNAPYAFRATYADNASVAAPLSLTSPSAATALSAYNSNGGNAVVGQSSLAGGLGVFGQATVAGARGVLATGLDVALSATASSGIGIYAQGSS